MKEVGRNEGVEVTRQPKKEVEINIMIHVLEMQPTTNLQPEDPAAAELR